jgi:hypothetical protein
MAFNYTKGEIIVGDLKAADDAQRNTKIDFGDDQIELVTNDETRLKVYNTGVDIIGQTHFSSSGQTELIRIAKAEGETKEISFENEGADIGSIYFNSAEHFFIRQENANNDLALRIGTTNAVRIDGSAGHVGIYSDSPSHKLDVNGDIRVRGNDIRDNSGNSAITFDGSANTTINGSLSFEDIILAELSIPGVDLQTDTNAFRFNCPYGLTVTALGLALDQHSTSGDVTVTVTNTTDTTTMITLSLTGTSLGTSTTTVTSGSCDTGDVITFAVTATPADAQGLRATLFFKRNV